MASTSMSSMSSPEHVIVFGLIAITIQLIRICIDMIQSASANQQAIEDEQNKVKTAKKKKNDENKKDLNRHKEDIKNSNKNNINEGLKQKSSYGSIISTSTENKGIVSSNSNISQDEEQQKPLLGKNDTIISTLSSNSIPANGRSNNNKRYHTLFTIIWIIYLLYFSIVWMIQILSIYHSTITKNSSYSIFITNIPTTILGMVSWICLLECFYCYTSHQYERYGIVQRFFHIMSSIMIWCTIMLQLLYSVNYQYNTISLNWYELLYIIIVSSCVIITLIQCRLLATVNETISMEYNVNDDNYTKQKKRVHAFQTSILGPLLKPYFWPDATSQSAILNRIRAISTWICVILSKVCSLISPLYLGWSSTSLAHGQYNKCINYIIIYNIISWLGTTLKECQSLVYLKVAQTAFVQLSETAFGHLHTLSLDWHLRKKLGEVIRSMDRGIAACDTLMKYLFLWLIPAFIECIVVCIIFATYFHYLPLAITILYFVIFYILITILQTIYRKQYRKALTKHDNEWHDIFTDSMINFETVKFFTSEKYEQERFKTAVQNYQAGSVHVQASLSLLNISQQIILKLCLASSLILATKAIQTKVNCCTTIGQCDNGISDCCQQSLVCSNVGMFIGDYVAVLTYTLQLFTPLNFLGSVYNSIVMAMIDLTSMSELLSENPDVKDAYDALILPNTNTNNIKNNNIVVEFDNVIFHYPTQPENRGLKGLSFQMKRGTTTAIVGPVCKKRKSEKQIVLFIQN